MPTAGILLIMATVGGTSPPILSERADVHKSCKSMETIVNVLNDYCEAAGALVSLQKKLAKALRETAGLKATGEIACECTAFMLVSRVVKQQILWLANAMNASASIFEVLSDIDSRFSKYVDKESESISAEVRKWFKKLAVSYLYEQSVSDLIPRWLQKEEKAHDERLSSANDRIKQAGIYLRFLLNWEAGLILVWEGQMYEKKAKKKIVDASEEHARYINLISTIGPQMSQDK